jgi:hypothetical protein
VTSTGSTTTTAAPTLIQEIETSVEAFIQKVVSEVEILIADAQEALEWVANLAPTVAADVTSAANFIESIPGVGSNPDVMAAVAAVNVANAGLQAFASSYETATTGGSVTVSQATNAVLAGYQAVKSAQSAAASAKAAVTGAVISTAPAATVPATPST